MIRADFDPAAIAASYAAHGAACVQKLAISRTPSVSSATASWKKRRLHPGRGRQWRVPHARGYRFRQVSISRSLYFYVKNAHYDAVPGLKEYVELFMSDKMIGDKGLLKKIGLIPRHPHRSTSG